MPRTDFNYSFTTDTKKDSTIFFVLILKV